MSESQTIDVGDALETLVHQFSDPWSFLRELIQNAIDAGSPEIEVNVEHEPSAEPDDPGLMVVEVVDFGAGMDRQIIDTRLTRLFSSAKDGDYTKIGRFGIGFVSVFAIEPDLVCVDTGRNGEYWRVLFRADRSFQRIVLETPVEGTTIKIYKRADEDEVEAAHTRARAVLDYWCKHARVELRCNDELISRPFGLDAHCLVEHEEDETKVLIGYVREREALRGYYHAGLTLHEEHSDALPHVAFKIDSRYLEHTLTRDNVIRDDNYAKAMAIVGRLARGPLIEGLVAALVERTAAHDTGEDTEFLRERLLELLQSDIEVPKSVHRAPIIPSLDAAGRIVPLSLDEVRKRIRRSHHAREPSPLCAALAERGDTVLLYDGHSWIRPTMRWLCGGQPPHVSKLCTALPATSVEAEAWQPLRDACFALLGKKVASDVVLGHLAYPESSVAGRVAITQAKFGELTELSAVGELSTGWFASKRVVVVNADHSTVKHLLEVARTEPELAAYLLLKLFYLRTELGVERDTTLLTQAAEARWRRSTT